MVFTRSFNIVDIQGTIGNAVKGIHWDKISSSLGILAIIVVMAILGGIIAYLIIQHKAYNIKIRIFENIAGRGWVHTRNDVARLVKKTDEGSELLWLKKNKSWKAGYGLKMGHNTYYFAIGSDGLWYNFILGDFDKALGQMGMSPIDKDIRMSNVAIRKALKEEFNKPTFLQQWGAVLGAGLFFIFIAVGLFLVGIQFNKAAGAMATVSDNFNHGQEIQKGNLELQLSILNKSQETTQSASNLLTAYNALIVRNNNTVFPR